MRYWRAVVAEERGAAGGQPSNRAVGQNNPIINSIGDSRLSRPLGGGANGGAVVRMNNRQIIGEAGERSIVGTVVKQRERILVRDSIGLERPTPSCAIRAAVMATRCRSSLDRNASFVRLLSLMSRATVETPTIRPEPSLIGEMDSETSTAPLFGYPDRLERIQAIPAPESLENDQVIVLAIQGREEGDRPAQGLGGHVAEQLFGAGVPRRNDAIQIVAHDRVSR